MNCWKVSLRQRWEFRGELGFEMGGSGESSCRRTAKIGFLLLNEELAGIPDALSRLTSSGQIGFPPSSKGRRLIAEGELSVIIRR